MRRETHTYDATCSPEFRMPEIMLAAVLRRPAELVVMEVPLPTVQPGQQLLRVACCGICGSDLRYLAGENPWARHTLGVSTPNPPDMILGHEIGGYGTWTEQTVPVGCLSFRGCGVCEYCRRGQEQLCADTAHLGHGAGWVGQNPGGMAQFCPIWTEHLYPLLGNVSVEAATFLDGLAVAVHAVKLAGMSPQTSVLVIGGGPIGLMIAQVARAFGAGSVTVADLHDAPLACATELGLASTLRVDAGSDLSHWAGPPPGLIFDTTRDLAAQTSAMRLLRRGGSLVLMAGPADKLQVGEEMLAGERRLLTCCNHRYEDFGLALELLAAGRVVVEPMITHRFPLEEAVQAFAVAADKAGSGALKVLLTMPAK